MIDIVGSNSFLPLSTGATSSKCSLISINSFTCLISVIRASCQPFKVMLHVAACTVDSNSTK